MGTAGKEFDKLDDETKRQTHVIKIGLVIDAGIALRELQPMLAFYKSAARAKETLANMDDKFLENQDDKK